MVLSLQVQLSVIILQTACTHLVINHVLQIRTYGINQKSGPPDGHKYYSYILLYVDDVMCIHHDGVGALNLIDKYFHMKEGSIGDPDMYLGAKLRKTILPNGVEAWAMSPSKYVQEAVKNVEGHLSKEKGGMKLAKRANTPYLRDYKPKLDMSPELGPTEAQYYQSQVGVLQWMVEIGRIDMITEVSMLASHLAMPREGHLECIFHIFAYLKINHNSRMVFDPSYPGIDMSQFKKCDWKSFYPEAKEAIPTNAPEPRGKEVDIRLYVDSDHAGDSTTRRSRSGCNNSRNSGDGIRGLQHWSIVRAA